MEEKVKLDQLDIELMAALQDDGRMSFKDISELLEVSIGTIRNRYNRLVQDNVLHIIGWADPVRAGYNSYARINIEVRPTEKIRSVADQLLTIPEVSFLAITSGQYDLEINLVCRDNLHLLDIMHERIHKIEGIYETHTTIYFQVLKWASHDVSNAVSVKNKLQTKMNDPKAK